MEKSRAKSSKACKGAAANKDHKCTVCHKSFCEPKLLPCGHLMCRKCLLSWLKQTRRATCPYCRYPILKNDAEAQVLPTSGGSKEDAAQSWDQVTEWDSDDTLQATVDQFPTDLSIEVAVKAEQLLNEKKKNCHVCDEPATSFCFQCGDTLCGACRNMHSKLVVTRHHVVEELSGLTTKRLADVQPPTPCPQHPDEPCRLYCPQHDTSLCLLCATSRHRDCPQVAEFDQLVEKSKTKLAELMKVLTNSSTEIDKALSELDQHLADTEQDTETALADIQTLKERLTKAVEDRCQQLVSQASAARDDIRAAVKEAKAILLSRQSRLGSHTALAQRVHDSKAHVVVCGMTSVMEVRLKELERHVELPPTAKVISKAALLLDQSAARNVEMDLAKLGQIKVEYAAIAASVADTFNAKHGPGVTLSDSGRIATRTRKSRSCSSVVVKNSMTVGIVTEVQVQVDVAQWDCAYNCTRVGVLTQVPDAFNLQQIQWNYIEECEEPTLIDEMYNQEQFQSEYMYDEEYIDGDWQISQQQEVQSKSLTSWVQCHDNLDYDEETDERSYNQQQQRLCESAEKVTSWHNQQQQFQCQEGYVYQRRGQKRPVSQGWILTGPVVLQSRLGVYLDDNSILHLCIDGRDCGTFPRRIQQPYCAVFDLGRIKQITLLPRRKL